MPSTAANPLLPLTPRNLDKVHPRSQAKRRSIVEAATRHFAEHGYEDARVADISLALGIAKGSIFQHFGSKDALFLEVYKRAVRSFSKYLDVPPEVREADELEIELIVSIIDWMVERFQDALLTAELDPGLFRRSGELPEKKEARIQQFLSVLERAIGAERPVLAAKRVQRSERR
ncbi:MAG: hypothetical protein DMF61_27475 [Blastocatellia bacterium AA13]|nr:MAG: hypothetical protein DMF61_27475 [Blastocatellia bacterium AA13]